MTVQSLWSWLRHAAPPCSVTALCALLASIRTQGQPVLLTEVSTAEGLLEAFVSTAHIVLTSHIDLSQGVLDVNPRFASLRVCSPWPALPCRGSP